MPRLKAPDGHSHPVLKGVELKPEADGCYHVAHQADVEALMSVGYVNVDAPAKPPARAALRDAVLGSLKSLGVAVPAQAPDDVLATALTDAIGRLQDRPSKEAKAGGKSV